MRSSSHADHCQVSLPVHRPPSGCGAAVVQNRSPPTPCRRDLFSPCFPHFNSSHTRSCPSTPDHAHDASPKRFPTSHFSENRSPMPSFSLDTDFLRSQTRTYSHTSPPDSPKSVSSASSVSSQRSSTNLSSTPSALKHRESEIADKYSNLRRSSVDEVRSYSLLSYVSFLF